MIKVKTREKLKCKTMISPAGVPRYFLLTTYTLVFSVLLAGCQQQLDVTVKEVRDQCPREAECVAGYTLEYGATEITAVWTLNGKFVFKEGPDIRQLDGYAAYYHAIQCDVSSFGELACQVTVKGENDLVVNNTSSMKVEFPVMPSIYSVEGAKVNSSLKATLKCQAKGYPSPNITWMRDGRVVEQSKALSITNKQDVTSANSTLEIVNAKGNNNGTYECRALNAVGEAVKPANLIVFTKPEVAIDYALGVGNGSIFLNWTLNNGNLPVLKYRLKYMREGSNQWQFSPTPLNVSRTSQIIEKLEPDASYWLQLEAENEMGPSGLDKYKDLVKTLDSEPHFKPSVEIKGSTSDSFTLAWNSPPEDIRHLIGHYIASYNAKDGSEREVYVSASEGAPVYLFTNLKPATNYLFQIRACNRYTQRCGSPSQPVQGKTLDGVPSPPVNVEILCERESNKNHVATVKWQAPEEPNGQLVHFTVTLTGLAFYHNEKRQELREDYGPSVQNVDGTKFLTRFEGIPPNTNYTVEVLAETKTRRGSASQAHCTMPASIPDRESLNGIRIARYPKADKYLLRVDPPKVSQRKGPVCCYSIVLVKMLDGKPISSLPEPHLLPLKTYEQVHREGAGAYIAEMFDADKVPYDGVFLGDENRIDKSNPPCRSCPAIFHLKNNQDETTLEDSQRIARSHSQIANPQMINLDMLSSDGPLKPESNYTMFIRVFATLPDGQVESVYGPYAAPLTPKPTGAVVHSSGSSASLVVALGVLCGLALVLLVIVSSLFFLRRYSKQVAQAEGVEMSLTSAFRHLWSRLRNGRHLLVSPSTTHAAPIAKSDILQAYLDRHQNADYGFQHEYELLPERFPDRTTRASDTRENLPKNRYPDIKAYDQTRVKLNAVNGDPHSDYVNANFVMGYKERKKFICAQGPMESTVYDFWRMAWEQRVEVIVMLTNIEEYNKTKCYQYWPDPDPSRNNSTPEPVYLDPISETQSNGGTNHSPSNGSTIDMGQQTLSKAAKAPQGDKMFGDIRVIHVKEKRFSEYVVRELQVSRPKASTPTDPEMGVMEREVRPVFQYHYLVWKDFQAPEHAFGILRFLRRLNEDYSADRGPILIHCSAGVGRTGTLVAIDHLVQQIEEEGCISVLNTVCDLRHQRNFLVQSLRQYIFVYRTLMEWVQFGNTEIAVAEFQESLTNLRVKTEGRTKSQMEDEFEKLTQPFDDRKPSSVAIAEDNRPKNRYEVTIPYDRNRVILTPVPGRDYSTYINASFIEGYDNSESFILTQDPTETTQRDFWRMVLEHNIAVLVMLSEMDGTDASCCPQYWPDEDQEVTHDHLVIKHVSTVTMPAYIQREFVVRSTKNREEMRTTQIQYLGWGRCASGLEDETVPSPQQISHFVAIAVETIAARARHLQSGSACIHCSTGSVRSSILVALCILIEQARIEGYVDVFTTARELRSQRPRMVEYFSQYAFLYDAIAYYLRTHPASLPSTP